MQVRNCKLPCWPVLAFPLTPSSQVCLLEKFWKSIRPTLRCCKEIRLMTFLFFPSTCSVFISCRPFMTVSVQSSLYASDTLCRCLESQIPSLFCMSPAPVVFVVTVGGWTLTRMKDVYLYAHLALFICIPDAAVFIIIITCSSSLGFFGMCLLKHSSVLFKLSILITFHLPEILMTEKLVDMLHLP